MSSFDLGPLVTLTTALEPGKKERDRGLYLDFIMWASKRKSHCCGWYVDLASVGGLLSLTNSKDLGT